MKNQTEELWLVGISPVQMGTGVFVLFSQNADNFGLTDWSDDFNSDACGSLRKALVQDIGYLDCVQRGSKEGVLAYKWVPVSLASYDVIKTEAKSCTKAYCVKRCAKYGCVCVGGECS